MFLAVRAVQYSIVQQQYFVSAIGEAIQSIIAVKELMELRNHRSI